jgi:CsoR family transcriptional regulator, copper-sensing transcriptional repressor
MTADEVTAHFEDHDRNGKRETHPEAAGHVDQLGVRTSIRGREFGFERHATDGAITRSDLADLWMHRASIDRAFRHVGGRRPPHRMMMSMLGMVMRGRMRVPATAPGFLAVLRDHLRLHLAIGTPGGYIRTMRKDIKASCQKRLNRIEGQVRGLAKMVDEDRYCIDIVTQISAVRSALRRVEEEILKDHVTHCVEHAINSGDKADQRRKIAELMEAVGRVDR